MFRNDVDLQIAGTTDVSDDAFFYAYHVFLDELRCTVLPQRVVTWLFFARELLQGTQSIGLKANSKVLIR